jgi:hypothetical protein
MPRMFFTASHHTGLRDGNITNTKARLTLIESPRLRRLLSATLDARIRNPSHGSCEIREVVSTCKMARW